MTEFVLRARMESIQMDSDFLNSSPLSIAETIEGLLSGNKTPQHVDLFTFRDALDVNYQRMALTGEELSGVGSYFVFFE